MELLFFLTLVTLAGAAGYGLLVVLGVRDAEAWGLGRTVGLALVALPAWWVGSFGIGSWPAVGAVVLAAGGCAGAFLVYRRRAWRPVAGIEVVFVGACLVAGLLRWGRPDIVETEKLMDLGILSSLIRTTAFPPPDMWLAGHSLPYYYWGGLPWALPLRLAGLDLAIGFNVVVVLLTGITAASLWVLGARLAGDRWAGGAIAAFFGVFAGTPDGLRQLAGAGRLGTLDLWASSRQVPDTITEFPLFSFWLGDLHPHVLSIPLAVAAIGVAAVAGSGRFSWRLASVAMVMFGLTWAANPWAMPPTLLAVVLMFVLGAGSWPGLDREGGARWAAAVVAAAGGWLVAMPFHLGFDPPTRAVRSVFAWTASADLLLYGGALLVPALFVVVRVAFGWGGRDRMRTRAVVAACAAATLIAAAASGRPTTVILSVAIAVLVARLFDPGVDSDRPALALAVLGLFVFLVPEIVYLDDGYGDKLHRMNTVFKAYIQGWLLLAVALPVLLRIGGGGKRGRHLLAAAVVIVSLPHLLSATVASLRSPFGGLDGLGWMDPGDRCVAEAAAEWEPGTTMIEAVGGAYSRYARVSAVSGVPTLLGWANHEMVWRGAAILDEIGRRKQIVDDLYGAGDPAEVRRLVEQEGIDLVTIGSLENQDFDAHELAAVREAGSSIVDCGPERSLVVFVAPCTIEGERE